MYDAYSSDVRLSEESVESFEGEIAPAFSRRIIQAQAANPQLGNRDCTTIVQRTSGCCQCIVSSRVSPIQGYCNFWLNTFPLEKACLPCDVLGSRHYQHVARAHLCTGTGDEPPGSFGSHDYCQLILGCEGGNHFRLH